MLGVENLELSVAALFCGILLSVSDASVVSLLQMDHWKMHRRNVWALFFFCTPWSFLKKNLVLQILIILLLCDLPQEKMLEEEHKLLALRMVILEHFLAFFSLQLITLPNRRHASSLPTSEIIISSKGMILVLVQCCTVANAVRPWIST